MEQILPILALALVSGLLSVLVMSSTLYLLHRLGFADVDFTKAVGSILTRSESRVKPIRIALHFSLGVVFALSYSGIITVYFVIWGAPRVNIVFHLLILGFLTGFAQGVVVGIILSFLVAKYHPLQRPQHARFGVTLGYIAGHVVLGLLVGFTLVTFGILWKIMINYAVRNM